MAFATSDLRLESSSFRSTTEDANVDRFPQSQQLALDAPFQYEVRTSVREHDTGDRAIGTQVGGVGSSVGCGIDQAALLSAMSAVKILVVVWAF